MSEDPPAHLTPDTPVEPDADLSPGDSSASGISPSDGSRLPGTIVGHLADQARRTTSAAKARRVVSSEDEPGVLDLTPLRELLAELVAELRKVRLRDRVAYALRQAADIIDSRTPDS